jgi:multidrug resistance efflux pump
MSAETERNPMPILDAEAGLTSLESIRSPKFIFRLTKICAISFIVLMISIVFLPWQQFIRGNGQIIAYNPLERRVVVEAPLSGRLDKSYVVDGKPVKKGDLLFELEDNDPELMKNLEFQAGAAKRRRDAVWLKVDSLELQLAEQKRAFEPLVAATRAKEAAKAYAAKTALQQYNRIKILFEDERGLVSQRDYELALLEKDRTEAEWMNAQAELQRVVPEGKSKIQSIKASLESARSELESAEQSLQSLIIKVNQTSRLAVVAPRDGIVQQVQVTEGTYLKEKSPLCTIIPKADKRLAEIYVDGNDMPLLKARQVSETGDVIQRGSPVRLQFEGWPAIQFIGWPSVARGTFGGEVMLIDPAGDITGRFRVLVAPDPEAGPPWSGDSTIDKDGWPEPRWLRQGVRAKGWVLLERVPLWFELWRQLNGFPPALSPQNSVPTETKL